MSGNILISSLSRKVPLIKAVREAMEAVGWTGQLIGGDSSEVCIGRYFVDMYWKMPLLEDLEFDTLLKYCKEHHVKAIIPTRTAELTFYAHNKQALQQQGIATLVSSLECVSTCCDKFTFAKQLKKENLPTICTSTKLELNSLGAYVVKERFGAGSENIGLRLSAESAINHSTKLKHPIFQPYIENSQEYSVDIYVKSSETVQGVIARQRDYVIDGESQITSSVKNKTLEELCMNAAKVLNIYGHAVFQVLKDLKNEYHLIECNPRFGGASTLAIAMGLNTFAWFLMETRQQNLPPFHRSFREKRQIRHAEDYIINL